MQGSMQSHACAMQGRAVAMQCTALHGALHGPAGPNQGAEQQQVIRWRARSPFSRDGREGHRVCQAPGAN